MNSLQFNLSRAIGPVIAGLLLAKAGAGWCFAVNALSFIGGDRGAADDREPPPSRGRGRGCGESLLGGPAAGAGQPAVARRRPCSAAPRSFLAFPLITYLPVIAGDVLPTGAAGYSLLLRASAWAPSWGRSSRRNGVSAAGPRPGDAPRLAVYGV